MIEITDFAKVPDTYKMLNTKFAEAVIKAGISIPGIKVVKANIKTIEVEIEGTEPLVCNNTPRRFR